MNATQLWLGYAAGAFRTTTNRHWHSSLVRWHSRQDRETPGTRSSDSLMPLPHWSNSLNAVTSSQQLEFLDLLWSLVAKLGYRNSQRSGVP
jgi:hypothetical protein